jgi:hypothetical protein
MLLNHSFSSQISTFQRKTGKMEETYTVEQVARFTRSAERIVLRWLDAERLKGFRCPITLKWKVAKSEMLKFMRENSIPIPDSLATPADASQSRPGANPQRR